MDVSYLVVRHHSRAFDLELLFYVCACFSVLYLCLLGELFMNMSDASFWIFNCLNRYCLSLFCTSFAYLPAKFVIILLFTHE